MDHQVFPGGGAQVTVDMVNNPPHYNNHPSGIEVIEITEGMGFCVGNAVKYILRHNKKGTPKQDLEKALWYIKRVAPWVETEYNIGDAVSDSNPMLTLAEQETYKTLTRYLIADDELPLALRLTLVDLCEKSYRNAYRRLSEYLEGFDS